MAQVMGGVVFGGTQYTHGRGEFYLSGDLGWNWLIGKSLRISKTNE